MTYRSPDLTHDLRIAQEKIIELEAQLRKAEAEKKKSRSPERAPAASTGSNKQHEDAKGMLAGLAVVLLLPCALIVALSRQAQRTEKQQQQQEQQMAERSRLERLRNQHVVRIRLEKQESVGCDQASSSGACFKVDEMQ
jgi:uncharacterized protein HemX